METEANYKLHNVIYKVLCAPDLHDSLASCKKTGEIQLTQVLVNENN